MKLKKEEEDYTSFPNATMRKIMVTCPCGRTFLQWWKKGTVRRVYCNACRKERIKEQKLKHRRSLENGR